MAHTATGRTGQLRVGGRSVAKLGKWTFDVADTLDGWIVEAKLQHADDFWMEREGVRFDAWLQIGSRYWVLIDVSFTAGTSSITIRGSGKPVTR